MDIVALGSKTDNTFKVRRFLIGLCKFKSEQNGSDELELTKYYAPLFSSANDACHYYVFSKSDFTSGLYACAEKGNVTLVSLDVIYHWSTET